MKYFSVKVSKWHLWFKHRLYSKSLMGLNCWSFHYCVKSFKTGLIFIFKAIKAWNESLLPAAERAANLAHSLWKTLAKSCEPFANRPAAADLLGATSLRRKSTFNIERTSTSTSKYVQLSKNTWVTSLANIKSAKILQTEVGGNCKAISKHELLFRSLISASNVTSIMFVILWLNRNVSLEDWIRYCCLPVSVLFLATGFTCKSSWRL